MIETVINEQLLCVGCENMVSFSRGKLIIRNNATLKKVIEYRLWRGIKKRKIIQRLMRLLPRAVVEIEKNVFLISCKGKMLKYDVNKNKLVVELQYKDGMSSPLYIGINDIETPEVCFGEYLYSSRDCEILIYMRINNIWNKVYSFPSNRIKHIHNIVWNSKLEKWVVLTGDTDEESGIWLADRGFKQLKPLIKGAQKYRACFAYAEGNSIIYATDSPDEQNYIRKIVFTENMVTEQDLFKINGSCIYGNRIGNDAYFVTCVEPMYSENKYRYLMTQKLPAGIKDRNVCVYKLR